MMARNKAAPNIAKVCFLESKEIASKFFSVYTLLLLNHNKVSKNK